MSRPPLLALGHLAATLGLALATGCADAEETAPRFLTDPRGFDPYDPSDPLTPHTPVAFRTTWSAWPEHDGLGQVVGYAGRLTVEYLNADFGVARVDKLCAERFSWTGEFTRHDGGAGCSDCVGVLSLEAFTPIPEESDCVFDPSVDPLSAERLASPEIAPTLVYDIRHALPDDPDFVTLGPLLIQVEQAGFEATHGVYAPDRLDFDRDGDRDEHVPWGIVYAAPGAWTEDFATTDPTPEGGLAAAPLFHYTWWIEEL